MKQNEFLSVIIGAPSVARTEFELHMRRILSIILSLAIGASPSVALAQNRRAGTPKAPQMGERPGLVRGDEITPAQEAAVERGLERLAARQQRDGSFGQTGAGLGATSGITALAGIAFMQAGNLPGRGKYGE